MARISARHKYIQCWNPMYKLCWYWSLVGIKKTNLIFDCNPKVLFSLKWHLMVFVFHFWCLFWFSAAVQLVISAIFGFINIKFPCFMYHSLQATSKKELSTKSTAFYRVMFFVGSMRYIYNLLIFFAVCIFLLLNKLFIN